MLAEPRNKMKWSSDPRNTHWASDKSKFGYQMMSKMGWSEGKGLGANEDGNVSHVKVTKKNNTLGVGAKTSHEDNWLAHQDDFNALLSSLNQKQGNDNAVLHDPDDVKPKSLEATVKKSKKKIFYSKFVKSKDLSRASKEDLDSIFGNRSKSAPSTPCDSEGESGNDSEASVASCPPKPAEVSGFFTTTSQLTMQDYFAKKMAAKSENIPSTGDQNNDCDNNSDNLCLVKKKKSKKRKCEVTQEDKDDLVIPKKNKKKNHAKKETSLKGEISHDLDVSKKSKKKSRKKTKAMIFK